MNKVCLIGRPTHDPEMKFLPNGETAVTTFTLAVERAYKKGAEKSADFIPIVVYGKTAEFAAQYIGKGKLAYVVGRLQIRSYDHKDGGKRYVTEIIAEEAKPIEWAERKTDFADMTPVDSGDIPF